MFRKLFSKPLPFILSMLVSVVLLAGCNLPVSTSAAPVATSAPSPSLTSGVPLNTASLPAPTPTPVPSMTATPQPDKLIFATGATAGVAAGSLTLGQTKTFTVYAEQHQVMILILNSPKNDLILGVTNPDGSTLLDPAKKWNLLQWLLPKTGAYTIQVLGAAGPED